MRHFGLVTTSNWPEKKSSLNKTHNENVNMIFLNLNLQISVVVLYDFCLFFWLAFASLFRIRLFRQRNKNNDRVLKHSTFENCLYQVTSINYRRSDRHSDSSDRRSASYMANSLWFKSSHGKFELVQVQANKIMFFCFICLSYVFVLFL